MNGPGLNIQRKNVKLETDQITAIELIAFIRMMSQQHKITVERTRLAKIEQMLSRQIASQLSHEEYNAAMTFLKTWVKLKNINLN